MVQIIVPSPFTARRQWYTTTICTASCRRSTTWPSAPCSPRCGTRRATSSNRATLTYDAQNRLQAFHERTGDTYHKTAFTYDKDSRVTQMDYDTDKGKVEYAYDTLGRVSSRKVTNGETAYETAYTFVKGADAYGGNATTPLVASIRQGEGDSAMNFAYEYDSRGNIVQENRNGKVTTYSYDALGQLIRVNDPNDPTAGESGTTWLYTYDRGGNILSKSYYRYTTGTPGVAHDTILYSYTDSNWKDKLTAYDGQTITYDAIGNPLNDGRRRYEWQAGRQLKKVYVKADLQEGTKPGVDEQSGTVLKIAWSNGNLLDGEVTSTQVSAEVTRNGEDVTSEYAASAFAWKRDSGNAGADETWNAAHAGKKALTLTEADLNGDVKITCTLTGNGPGYGSIAVDEDMDATHTRGTLDANDTFQIVNGELKVTTSRGNVYALEDGKVKAAGAKLNGSITAESKLFASQPEDMVEFSYDHNGLRTQKKVTKADGAVEATDYVLHGKLLTHLTRGNDEMHFFYDAQSRPTMVDFNGMVYSYVHNFQGDIVGIVDSAGSLVVEYKYDAWGKPTLVRTLTTAYEALAELNPFRYRGYVWDEETELYYLRSRYYSPDKTKFLNADTELGLQNEIFYHSIFLYCGNDPINKRDSDGAFWFHIAVGVIGALCGAVTQIATNLATGKDWSDNLIGAAVGGAVYNLVSYTVPGGAAYAAYAAAAAEAVTNEVEEYVRGKEINWSNVCRSISKVLTDTAINGTIYSATGRLASQKIRINPGWFKPQSLAAAFMGNYTKKVIIQSAYNAGYNIVSLTIKEYAYDALKATITTLNPYTGRKTTQIIIIGKN